jgi:hypothetical protein
MVENGWPDRFHASLDVGFILNSYMCSHQWINIDEFKQQILKLRPLLALFLSFVRSVGFIYYMLVLFLWLGGNCEKLKWPMMQRYIWGGCPDNLVHVLCHVYHQTRVTRPFPSNSTFFLMLMVVNGRALVFHGSHDHGFALVWIFCCLHF